MLCLSSLNVDFLGKLYCIVNLNSEVTNCALHLCVTKKELHGSQVAGAAVDQRGLCSPERMSTEYSRVKPNACHPLLYQTRILPGCEIGFLSPVV